MRDEAVGGRDGSLARGGTDEPAGRGEDALSRGFCALANSPYAILLVGGVGMLLFVGNLGAYPIYTKGEPREAIRVLDIVQGGGWILPTQGGIGLPWKPPLMYWLSAFVSLACGRVNEWTVRLPSGLFAAGGMVVCYAYVRRLFDAPTALLSALILGTTFQYEQAGTAARVDMTLSFFTEVAFFEFLAIAEGLTARRMLLYGALALAILAKGPVGVVLPAAVALVWIAVYRRWRLFGELKLFRGGALVTLMAGGWYAAATAIGGAAFVRRQILEENLYRLLPNPAFREPHAHAFYFVELALLAGFLPWSALLPQTLSQFLRRRLFANPRVGYLLVWFLIVLLFYNVVQSKRGVYLLALYPAAAALTGLALSDTLIYAGASRRWVAILQKGGGLFVLAAGVAGAFALRSLGTRELEGLLARAGLDAPALAGELESALSGVRPLGALASVVLVAAGFWMLCGRTLSARLFAGLLAATSVVILVSHFVIVPALANTLTLRGFTAESMRLVGGETVADVGSVNYAIAFYSRRVIPTVPVRDIGNFAYLFCSERDYRLIPARMRADFVPLLRSGPTDLGGGGRMLLLKRAGKALAGATGALRAAAL